MELLKSGFVGFCAGWGLVAGGFGTPGPRFLMHLVCGNMKHQGALWQKRIYTQWNGSMASWSWGVRRTPQSARCEGRRMPYDHRR